MTSIIQFKYFVIMAYRASTLRGLAVAQMVFGALMIIFGLACIFAAHHWSSYVAFGVWVGSWVSKEASSVVHNISLTIKLTL